MQGQARTTTHGRAPNTNVQSRKYGFTRVETNRKRDTRKSEGKSEGKSERKSRNHRGGHLERKRQKRHHVGKKLGCEGNRGKEEESRSFVTGVASSKHRRVQRGGRYRLQKTFAPFSTGYSITHNLTPQLRLPHSGGQIKGWPRRTDILSSLLALLQFVRTWPLRSSPSKQHTQCLEERKTAKKLNRN